ncbi:hypothetical protein IEO21_09162 [Rhodonia placenta]|uniref:Uncharacterized protein n=1 Tax=Rhodonia placenta TaxID=104341 RepID=A0A8H7NVB2_9APHY|nr:hypothetical protein IEO21_09162 [Postia placenta]
MTRFECWKFTMILVPGHARRRGKPSAAKMKTIRSVVVEIFVFSVGGRSARICLCLTRATPFVKTAIMRSDLLHAQVPPNLKQSSRFRNTY